MARPVAMTGFVMVGPAGPLATITREPGQARKGAATAGTSCAGVWLAGFASISLSPSLSCIATERYGVSVAICLHVLPLSYENARQALAVAGVGVCAGR